MLLIFGNFFLDFILTVSLPVMVENKIVGTVAMDNDLPSILSRPLYFHPNENSYTFVIDNRGMNRQVFSAYFFLYANTEKYLNRLNPV